jgi:hypothetical protein
MRVLKSLRMLAAAGVVLLAFTGTTALAVDITSSAQGVKEVFTRTSDTSVVVPASGQLNLPVPLNLHDTSTLIIKASFTGIANSERSYTMNCLISPSGIPCHPFSATGHFHPGARDTHTFTTVVRNVPRGSGTLELGLVGDCSIACGATEEITVENSAVVVEAAKE